MINDFASALARDPWPLLDIGYYLLGLHALTWGGNLACRLLLTWSGITLPPPEAAAVANLPAPSPAQSAPPPSAQGSNSPQPSPGALTGLAPLATPAAPAPTSAAAAVVATPIPRARPATSARAGRMIGSLERIIIFLGLAAGSWEIIAAVIALKTVGRFKELDQQLHAEYFLIGSLASMVWATLISLILIWFDRHLGFNISGLLAKAP